MKLRYIGTSDVRVINKEDWASIDEEFGGPIDHASVTWNVLNEFTANVSDDAAQFLIKYDPEFEVIGATKLKSAPE